MKWNGMAKPLLWKWKSCGYIGGGCIFQNEIMHAILLGEANKKIWMANLFQKKSKLTMDISLNKAQHKHELLCG
jgi:hypothetical protein